MSSPQRALAAREKELEGAKAAAKGSAQAEALADEQATGLKTEVEGLQQEVAQMKRAVRHGNRASLGCSLTPDLSSFAAANSRSASV